jgi:hypothetical protein
MVFRQRWRPCLGIGFSKIEHPYRGPIFQSSCKNIGYGLNAELFHRANEQQPGIPDGNVKTCRQIAI